MVTEDCRWHRRWTIYIAALFIAAGVVALAAGVGRAQAADDEWQSGRGWLGVYIQTVDKDLAQAEGLKTEEGVLVTGVMKDSPAEKAGIQKGDVIVRFDGKDTPATKRLTRLIESSDPGDKKEIIVFRDGKEKPLTVILGTDENADFEGDFSFELPDVNIEVPDPPVAPRAYMFSLGQLSTSRIGVALYDLSDQLAGHFGAKDGGALINKVEKGGPADKAGLQAGDVIVEIDHKPVANTREIRRAVQKKDDGDVVTVMVIRSPNEQKTVDVKVESSDTWSGIGDPQRFRVRTDKAARQFRQQLRSQRDARREVMREWKSDVRDDLKEQLDELREQLEDLRQELKNLKK